MTSLLSAAWPENGMQTAINSAQSILLDRVGWVSMSKVLDLYVIDANLESCRIEIIDSIVAVIVATFDRRELRSVRAAYGVPPTPVAIPV